jgi:hypothetical protein
MASLEQILDLSANGDAASLKAALAPMMPAVRRGLAERGRSVHIALAATTLGTSPSAKSILGLIQMRKAGFLDATEFWYVMTAVELHLVASEHHDSEVWGPIAGLAERELDDAILLRAEAQLSQLAT